RYLLCSVVRGPKLVGALEGHMLEHVGETGLSHRVLGRARVHQCEEGKDRRLGTLADEKRQAVRELLHRNTFFKGSDILGGGESRQQQKNCHNVERAILHSTSVKRTCSKKHDVATGFGHLSGG